jgi:hypothetical protein
MKHYTKLIITTILIILNLSLSAQTLSKLYVVKNSAQIAEGELVSKNVRDVNGDVCAGLIIITDLTGLKFQSNNGIVKVNNDTPGKYFLFLSPTERVVEVFKTGYEPLKIILYDYGIFLKSGQSWQIKVTGDKKLDLIPINIITEPAGAKIYIDGTLQESGTTFKTSLGKHKIKIEKEGYKTIEKKIEVSETNTLFNFKLSRVEPVLVTIKSIPTGASLFVDNVEKGVADRQLFLFPGKKYRLRLTLSGYLDINKEIEVKENLNNTFTYNLSKNTVALTLDITPSDAKVLLNKEDFSNRKKIKLAPGMYMVEISKEGYNPITDYLTLELGKPQKKTYSLVQKTGNLQLTVQPIDADVRLLQNSKLIKSWRGSKYLRSLAVGKYNLEVNQKGYKSKKEQITISENETVTKDISLKKIIQSSIGQSAKYPNLHEKICSSPKWSS